MALPDWHHESSNSAKSVIIGKPWGSKLHNSYLWYFMGKTRFSTESAELDALINTHFHDTTSFGDVEPYPCNTLPGNLLLRLRGNVILLPAVLYRGLSFPLFQVGHGEDPDRINFALRWPT